MDRPLTSIEARVLGCLVEKELTTPEYYPLTLNSLIAACNQKSNRDPGMLLNDTDVVRALDSLRDQKLAWEVTSNVGRTPKYQHGLREAMKLSPLQLAILCELLVRGPQTAGELRTHASRMAELPGIDHVLTVLGELIQRAEGPLAAKMAREPGKREERYAHLLSGPVAEADSLPRPAPEPARLIVAAENERLAKLETEVAALHVELAAVKDDLARFRDQFK